MQIPSVGRIVHYRSYGTPGGEFTAQCRAAVITEVATLNDLGITQAHLDNPETREGLPSMPVVGLCVLNPTGLFFHGLADGGCEYDEDAARGGTWHWPERIPDE
jgi:hypothetical protein